MYMLNNFSDTVRVSWSFVFNPGNIMERYVPIKELPEGRKLYDLASITQ